MLKKFISDSDDEDYIPIKKNRNKPHISLDISSQAPWDIKSEGKLFNAEQNPIHWYIHNYDDPDFIVWDSYGKVKILKPMVNIEYNNEYYLYIFDFSLTNGIDKKSIIYKMMKKFRKITDIDGIEEMDGMWFIFLTDETLPNYDTNNECILDSDGEIIEGDDAGGHIHFSEL